VAREPGRTDRFSLVAFLKTVFIQAQAALMHDAVLVLVETFNKLLWKKPEMFKTNAKRTLSNGNLTMSIPSSQNLGLDCNSGRTSGNQWEHGEKISRFLRKVRKQSFLKTRRRAVVVRRRRRKTRVRALFVSLIWKRNRGALPGVCVVPSA